MPRPKNNITIFIVMFICTCSSKAGQEATNFENTVPDNIAPMAQGCKKAVYDHWQTSKYVLSYPTGKAYKVTLGHCDSSYHSAGRTEAFAIDFNLAIGKAITASRSGKIVIVEESGRHGEFPNNLVLLQHSDRTFAQYEHLTFEGALVENGQMLEQGDIIGLSGKTGLAGFLHLHLVMSKEREYSGERKKSGGRFQVSGQ